MFLANAPTVAGSFSSLSRPISSLLKQFSQSERLTGITPATHLDIRPDLETVSSGIPQIDALTGGLPRGCLTEISGPDSSGRTSLLIAALAAATSRQETCALLDVSDAFDPHSAADVGLNLERLLWVRCGLNPSSPAGKRRKVVNQDVVNRGKENHGVEDPVEQALRATDLLLQGGGFGLLALDLAGIPWKTARRIPLTTWFRFRRTIENTSTMLLVITRQPCAQTCASLQLVLSSHMSVLSSWFSVLSKSAGNEIREKEQAADLGLQTSAKTLSAISYQLSENEWCKENLPAHARLLEGLHIKAELLRNRTERKPVLSVGVFSTKAAWTA
jgi:hypothetical protein